VHGLATDKIPTTNSFSLRRARIKFTYEALDGVNLVLCPNFEIDRVRLTDVYVQLNDRWLHTFSLWVGLFNRPSYEVEYSSASREFAERTLMTRVLYPQERDQGAKLEANFLTQYEIPLKIQLAVLNGNFGLGESKNQVKDVDNTKDLMARAVYSLKFPSKGLGIDFGGLGYLGNNKVVTQTTPPAVFTDVNGNKFTPVVGDNLKKEWFGGEMQVYYDFLGGTSFKSEYVRGTISGFKNTDFPAQVNPLFNANKVRNIEGYYFSLIKNVGKEHMLSARFDVFDPNTKKSGNEVDTIDDLKYHNWTFAYQYFFNENIKIMLSYLMPINEKSSNPAITNPDYANVDHKDNILTLRFQARF
jgi:phosphate-selective porin